MGFVGIVKRTVASCTEQSTPAPTSTKLEAFSSETSLPIPTPPGKDANFGSSPVLKTFYEGKTTHCGQINWVETPPKQLSKKVSKAHDSVAIKVYKVADGEQPTVAGRTPLKTESIDVQSPLLVTALKDVLKDVGVFLETHETAKFTAPFKPLFFSYEKILALYKRTNSDSDLKEHLHLLMQLLNELFGAVMSQLRHLRESKLVSYKLAWTYFPKGSIIYCGAEDCERLFKVVNTQYINCPNKQCLSVSCQEMYFSGATFEWRAVCLEIPPFRGNVPVDSLPHYPLEFHSNPESLKSKLTIRGKKVLDYQDLKYCGYSGTGSTDDEAPKRYNVSGRILVDFHGYAKHHQGLQRLEKTTGNQALETQGPEDTSTKTTETYRKRLNAKEQAANKEKMLARAEDLMFVSPMLLGFALKDKLWLRFYVDDVKTMVWNDEAYDHLVYPEGQKDLVLTFVENHQRMKAGLDDVIVGKGQGLISLLSGPPGTGKTLLAEAVADRTRRPLYYLQAEELGTNAKSLGRKVKKVFEMATDWNAVILLDEADVFMAERSPSDVARNELVSIFLRELEYFQGIIFLTTNLSDTIDIAFRSRVNIHLLFSPLSFSSRRQLWQKFLFRIPPSDASSKAPSVSLSDGDLDQLAAWELNGREIKNAIKTVRTWCLCKGYQLSLERLESGVAVTAPRAKKVEVETQ